MCIRCCGLVLCLVVPKFGLPTTLLWQSGRAMLLCALVLVDCGPVHRLVKWLIWIIGSPRLRTSIMSTRSRIPRWPETALEL